MEFFYIIFRKFYRTYLLLSFVVFPFLLFSVNLFAQSCTCGGTVPTFTVDLSSKSDTTYTQSGPVRDDLCCAASGSDECIKFIVTVNALTTEVAFNVKNPAPPGGAFYQVDCGPSISLGDKYCISSTTTFCITYCKAGGDAPDYIIQAGRGFTQVPNITVTQNCTGVLTVSGLTEASITWTSVFPAPNGAYNSYLSCLTACSSTSVTPTSATPSYVDYKVCGTKASGCPATICDTVRVFILPGLTATLTPTNVSCFGGSTGSASAVVSGGSPPYTYSWNDGQTASAATGLVAGTYSLSVTGTDGCLKTFTVSVTEPAAPLSSSSSQNNVSCFGGSNGTTTVTAAGGTPAYTYLWNNGQTTSTATGLIAGNYTVTITDANTCTTTAAFTITEPVILSSTSSQTNVYCFGGSNGTATVTAAGGTLTYSYLWNNGQTTSTATGLNAGNYTVTITDAKGCTTTSIVSITQPAAALS
ncbi:MAG: SprB repeat-containing protein, partial [Bacteroidetes bacterium]|nr:SprB repeat-containing protein [Bacteroidota bacterium]